MSLFLTELNSLGLGGRERILIESFYREVVFSPRPFSLEEIEASVSWISAMAFKSLAAKETQSKTIRFILGQMKLPIQPGIDVRIPHYWAPFYHDGPGPRVPRKSYFFVSFPKGQDPRRPRNYKDEVDPKQVKSLWALGPDALKRYKRIFGEQMRFFRKRGAWKGDRFFDRTERKYGKQIGDLAQTFLDSLFALWGDYEVQQTINPQSGQTKMSGMLYLIWRIVYRKSPLRA
jgi:hypothetical protein